MILHLMVLLLMTMLSRATTTSVDEITQALPHCPNKCGNVTIPYPFGTKENSYLDIASSYKSGTPLFKYRRYGPSSHFFFLITIVTSSSTSLQKISKPRLCLWLLNPVTLKGISNLCLDPPILWSSLKVSRSIVVPLIVLSRLLLFLLCRVRLWYQCKCARGYKGNAYLPNGCKDIDECAGKNECIYGCLNMKGGYNCSCPSGQQGDGWRNGTGCLNSTPFTSLPPDGGNSSKIRYQGGYGTVYKGTLEDNRTVAIKIDIKSSNILLTDDYTAKVSDFGISKFIPIDQTHVQMLVHGTLGYIDLEYFRSGMLTEKSDVYSFGMLLVELLTGRKVFSHDGTESDLGLAVGPKPNQPD
nr:wall-associated receptor kinase 2-like [Tanacetum cinerariifolium]